MDCQSLDYFRRMQLVVYITPVIVASSNVKTRHGLCLFAGQNGLPAMPKIAGKFVIFSGKNL